MFPRLAFIADPRKLSAADHLKRLESSPIYRRREAAYALAHVKAQAKAHWYLSPKFIERWPDRPEGPRRGR